MLKKYYDHYRNRWTVLRLGSGGIVLTSFETRDESLCDEYIENQGKELSYEN